MKSTEQRLKDLGGWRLGFLSQTKTVSIDALTVNGKIPAWLQGSFVSTGPALFEVNGQHVGHWFEGLAMLKGFYFNNGQVAFKNKMLQSDTYKQQVLGGPENEFFDNGNVTVFPFGDTGSAMTESPFDCSFDPKSLETIGHMAYQGELSAHLTLAHILPDPASNKYLNLGIQFGPETRYLIYTIDPLSLKQEVIASYESPMPLYMHSFSVTKRYIILFQSPLLINVEALMSDAEFAKMLTIAKGAPTQFIVIDRATGRSTTAPYEESMCFHQVNAFEDGDNIVVDSCDYADLTGYNDALFEAICNPEQHDSPALLRRHTINLLSAEVTTQQLSASYVEFPRINDAYGGLKYQYAYLALMTARNNFFNGLIKVDVTNKKDFKYFRDNCYFGEPVFVAKPNAATEGDGVVFSMAFDAVKNQSLLVVLDAKSWTELAHAYLPIPIPFGLHGHWFSDS